MKRNPYECSAYPNPLAAKSLKHTNTLRKFEEDGTDPPLCDIAKQKLEELNWAYDEIIKHSFNSSYYASSNQYQATVQIISYTDIYSCLTRQVLRNRKPRRNSGI